MKYYTGLLALSQYADETEDSAGLGSQAYDFLSHKEDYLADTEGSPLGDKGIIDTFTIPTNENIKCANHTRAYCDMLIQHKFEELEGLYEIALRTYASSYKIFKMARNAGLYEDTEILNFMNHEYGSYFRSFLMKYGEDQLLSKLMEG